MSEQAPALLPLFRSANQLRLLGVLFSLDQPELSITDLAARARVDDRTAGREVRRLARHGVLHVRKVGRTSLVSANWEAPWARALAQLLAQTVGVPILLADALHDIDADVFVFGSWAARHLGQPGPPPRDVDVAVIGDDVDLDTVSVACQRVADQIGLEVNLTIRSRQEWEEALEDSFLGQVRAGPLVPVVRRRADDAVA